MMKKLFNDAAVIFHKLFLRGETNVSKFINQYDLEKIFLKRDTFNIYDDSFDVNTIVREIGNGDYSNALAYLLKLDKESENFAKIVGYIKSHRDYNESLCDSNDVMIFPTYYGLDHYYHGNDSFVTLFRNLYFIDKSIFKGNQASVNNFYLDSDRYEEKVEVGFVQYPMNKTFKEYVPTGSFLERSELDDLDRVFLERVKHVHSLFTDIKNIPSIIFAPEMVGSKNLDDQLKKLIQSDKDLACMICPSYHKTYDKGRPNERVYNESAIFVNEDRMSVPSIIRKFVPAKIEGVLEKIETSFMSIAVIHVKNFGRVMVVICLDFIETIFRGVFESVMPSLVIVQCYSTSLRTFDTRIREICKHNACVVIGNACSAIKEKHYDQEGTLVCGSRNCYSESEEIRIEKSCFVDKECIQGCVKNPKCCTLIKINMVGYDKSKGYHPENYLEFNIERGIK